MQQGIKLQILIATYRQEGLNRIANGNYPSVQGVEYLISCQGISEEEPSETTIPEAIKNRDDMKVFFVEGEGSAVNRNHLFDLATAPWVLVSDDDLCYDENVLGNAIDILDLSHNLDFATFTYYHKGIMQGGATPFRFPKMPKGYYLTCFELALKRETYRKVRFDERFGVNCLFPAAEEDIYLHRLLKGGYKGAYFPLPLCSHDHPTTSDRISASRTFLHTKGITAKLYHPHSYLLRIIVQSYKYHTLHPQVKKTDYIKWALEGIKLEHKSRRVNIN